MIEHNAANRQQLERIPVEYHIVAPNSPPGTKYSSSQQESSSSSAVEVKGDESSEGDGCGQPNGRNTSIRSLISLFLKHYQSAEGATIEVRLSRSLLHVYMYMYVYMYTCTCTCIHVRVHVYVHVHYTVHTCTHVL